MLVWSVSWLKINRKLISSTKWDISELFIIRKWQENQSLVRKVSFVYNFFLTHDTCILAEFLICFWSLSIFTSFFDKLKFRIFQSRSYSWNHEKHKISSKSVASKKYVFFYNFCHNRFILTEFLICFDFISFFTSFFDKFHFPTIET